MLRNCLVLFVAACFLCGCSKDDPAPSDPRPASTTLAKCFADGDVVVSNVWGIPENVTFDNIRAEVSGEDWRVITTLETGYSGGGAWLSLPESFSAGELMKAGRYNASDYTGYWPAVTDDPAAKVAALKDINAYDGDKKVGRIYLSDWTGTGSKDGKMFVYFQYADRDFSLSGYNFTLRPNGQKSFRYEASFKNGWNAYAQVKESDNMSLFATSVPADHKLYWLFESHIY